MTSWPTALLGEICDLVGGGTPSRTQPEYFGGGIPWATPTDVTALRGRMLIKTRESITETGLRSSSARMVPAGTVLLTSRATIGYTAIAAVPMATNQGFANFICRSEIDPYYLAYWLEHQREQLIHLAGGTTFKEITKSTLRKLPVPVPPLPEQRRIVDILDRAASIRALRRQAQDTARLIIPALFNKMFGDPATNPMGWPVARLSELGALERGRSRHRPRNDPVLLGGPYPLIQTGEIAASHWFINSFKSSYSELGLQQSRMWPKGTLCITIAANIANSGILAFDACFPDSVVAFTPDKRVNVFYAKACMDFLREGLERLAPQLAQKNINLEILSEIPFQVPPLDLQNSFADHVSNIIRITERQVSTEAIALNVARSIQAHVFG